MTHENKSRSFNLDDFVRALREDVPSTEQVDKAGARVWARLQNQDVAADVEQIRGCSDVRLLLPARAARKLSASRALLVDDHLRECAACRNYAHTGSVQPVLWEMPKPKLAKLTWGTPRFAMAAAALVVLVGVSLLVASYLQTPAGPRATLQSASGSIYRVSASGTESIQPGAQLAEGELVRTSGGAHAFVRLRDGSIVEMAERSEFSVSAGRRDTTVHLDQGRIIVQAAHRRTGHLYVMTPDAKVAVTGTVFSVNTGLKGSRVSVIEGAVRVSYNGTDDLLHPGDQANTGANLSPVPVSDDIAWSADLDKHLALLAEFAKIKKQLEQIPMPGMRYESAVLDKLPANTVFYASIPNLGDALNQANNIFQNELQQSPVLRDWWAGKTGSTSTSTVTHPSFNEMVQKLHGMSQYLGAEIVVAGFAGADSGSNGVVVIAPIKSPGLKQFLDTEFTNLVSHDGQTNGLNVLAADQLNAATTVPGHELTAVVGDQFLMISPNMVTLRLMSNQLNSSGGFTQTPFGQRLADAYSRGAGLLFGADFKSIIAANQARNPDLKQSPAYLASGFSDMDYLLVEHHDLNGVPDNRAVLTFTGQRHGMASWLATPNPIGSLDFVSSSAGGAISFLSKDPASIFDDMMSMTGVGSQNGVSDTDSKLNLNIRNDIAAQLGGDVTIALDGPVLPNPSWKLVLQVNNSGTLQYSIGKLVDAINAEAAQHQSAGVSLTSANIDGRTYYTLRPQDSKALGLEFDYTYSDGYMIVAPSRALVQAALHTKQTGDTLAASSTFQNLLPKDGHVNFSALMYQNLGPLLQPLASQLTSQQMQALQQISSDSKPTVICAYASGDRIEVASASNLIPIDFNSLSIATLLGGRHGTSTQQ